MTTTDYTWPADVRARVERLAADLGDKASIWVHLDEVGYWQIAGTSADGLTNVRIAISDEAWREVKS